MDASRLQSFFMSDRRICKNKKQGRAGPVPYFMGFIRPLPY